LRSLYLGFSGLLGRRIDPRRGHLLGAGGGGGRPGVGAAATPAQHAVAVGRRVLRVVVTELVLDLLQHGTVVMVVVLLLEVLQVLVVQGNQVVVAAGHHRRVVRVVAIAWRRLRRLQVLEVREVRRRPKVEGAGALQFGVGGVQGSGRQDLDEH